MFCLLNEVALFVDCVWYGCVMMYLYLCVVALSFVDGNAWAMVCRFLVVVEVLVVGKECL